MYRAIQRQANIATPIAETFTSYEELEESAYEAGFDVEEYIVEAACEDCGGWYAIDMLHNCIPIVVEPAGWQPYEPAIRPSRSNQAPATPVSQERVPRRSKRNMNFYIVAKEYNQRTLTAKALELGLMVSVKPFGTNREQVIIRVQGTRRRVYIFQGYSDRVNY